MKAQTAKQVIEKKPHIPFTSEHKDTAGVGKSAPQKGPSFDDLHARISTRAYELYVERGYREGGSLQDWLDAEREILSREFPS